MIIFKRAEDLQEYLSAHDLQVHFVPTMGALHEGHISLIRHAQNAQETTLCSIFVNPTQFNNASDLQHYPRTVEADIQLLTEQGCDILYLPSVEDIYPHGTEYTIDVDITIHDKLLEGQHRPGHFAGVVQVVDRFLSIINPKAIYLGEKDLQQVQVISQLVVQKHPKIQVVPCPTLRDDDGLAKSSRNQRLTPEERATAPIIHKVLKNIVEQKNDKDFKTLQAEAISVLESSGLVIEYLEMIDTQTWTTIEAFQESSMAILIAAYLGKIRLIDNILF